MSNQFIARKGLISLGDSQFTGSVTISGSLLVNDSPAGFWTGSGVDITRDSNVSISGSLFVTESSAHGTNQSHTHQFTGSMLVSGSITVQSGSAPNYGAISASVVSGSFVGDGSGLTGIVHGLWTGSDDGIERFGNVGISGSLFVTESSAHGTNQSHTHQFTGSVSITGSMVIKNDDQVELLRLTSGNSGSPEFVIYQGLSRRSRFRYNDTGDIFDIETDLSSANIRILPGNKPSVDFTNTLTNFFDAAGTGIILNIDRASGNTGISGSLFVTESSVHGTNQSHTHQFTGSMLVSGSITVQSGSAPNYGAISASVFSGSFVGDGSGLTGLSAGGTSWTASDDGISRLGDVQVTGSLFVSGSPAIIASLLVSGTSEFYITGSDVFSILGSSGSLFSVVDSFSGSLFAVSAHDGIPILEVFSDDTVIMGEFGTNTLFVSESKVGIHTITPTANFSVSGSGPGVIFEVTNSINTTSASVGFYTANAVLQPSGTGETTGYSAVGGTNVNSNDTFTGNVGSNAYTLNDVVKAMKLLGLLTS